MNQINISRYKVVGKAVPWWWRFAYLIPDVFKWREGMEEQFTKVLTGKDTAFVKFVEGHVGAFIEKGTMPPAQIAAPIMNIAEDVIAGREVVMRAGDYIALESFRRAKAK
jgi:hypothetical protein